MVYEHHGRVAVITVDRPHRRNAIDGDTAQLLRRAWQHFEIDDKADVGVLTGSGGHFGSGADLKSFDLVDMPEGFLGFTRMTVSKPTIAAIEGYCVAGGLEMALWCDLRVAAENSVFGCFERRFGVPLVDGGTQRLPRIVGEGMAMEMILTGRPVDAEEAHAIGLVNMVVEDGAALDVALELGARIAQFPQPTLRSDRMALIEGIGMRVGEGLARERMLGLEVYDNARRGAARFAAGAGRSGRLVGWLSPVRSEPVEEVDEKPEVMAAAADVGSAQHVQHPAVAQEMVAVEETTDDLPEPAAMSAAMPSNHDHHGDDESPVGLVWGLPPAASGPMVLVLSESGKVDDQTRLMVERLSNAGFLTLAVDLPDLSAEAPSRVGVSVDAAISRLFRHPVGRGEGVGLVGVGLGGGVALWYATIDERVRAVVSYAGRMPSRDFNPRYDDTRAKFLGHYGKDDSTVSAQFAYDLEIMLRDRGIDATFNIYRDAAENAFELSTEEDDSRAALAFRRTVAFLTRAT